MGMKLGNTKIKTAKQYNMAQAPYYMTVDNKVFKSFYILKPDQCKFIEYILYRSDFSISEQERADLHRIVVEDEYWDEDKEWLNDLLKGVKKHLANQSK